MRSRVQYLLWDSLRSCKSQDNAFLRIRVRLYESNSDWIWKGRRRHQIYYICLEYCGSDPNCNIFFMLLWVFLMWTFFFRFLMYLFWSIVALVLGHFLGSILLSRKFRESVVVLGFGGTTTIKGQKWFDLAEILITCSWHQGLHFGWSSRHFELWFG